jgi:hypothetical protein
MSIFLSILAVAVVIVIVVVVVVVKKSQQNAQETRESRRSAQKERNVIGRLAIGAVYKNEAHILQEWIEHYLAHGVDTVFLINDKSTDNHLQVRKLYENNGRVVFYDAADDDLKGAAGSNRQTRIYNTYLLPHAQDFEWFGIFDLDEFLYSPQNLNIRDLIFETFSNADDVSQIGAHWIMFGSSGHVEQPKQVVSSFRRRCDIEPGSLRMPLCFKWTKSIVRTIDLKSFGIHSSKVHSGRRVVVRPSLLSVNHYAIQSLDFFRKVKMTRGCVLTGKQNTIRNMDYFRKYDRNDVQDDALYEQNAALGISAQK